MRGKGKEAEYKWSTKGRELRGQGVKKEGQGARAKPAERGEEGGKVGPCIVGPLDLFFIGAIPTLCAQSGGMVGKEGKPYTKPATRTGDPGPGRRSNG